jgi:hypothetical protein
VLVRVRTEEGSEANLVLSLCVSAKEEIQDPAQVLFHHLDRPWKSKYGSSEYIKQK